MKATKANAALQKIRRRLTPEARALVDGNELVCVLQPNASWVYLVLLSKKSKRLIYLGQSLIRCNDDMLSELACLMGAFQVQPTAAAGWAGMTLPTSFNPTKVTEEMNTSLGEVATALKKRTV